MKTFWELGNRFLNVGEGGSSTMGCAGGAGGAGRGRMKSRWEDDGISAFRDEIAASGEEGEMVTRSASLSA